MKSFEVGTKIYANFVRGGNHPNSKTQKNNEGSNYTQERNLFHE